MASITANELFGSQQSTCCDKANAYFINSFTVGAIASAQRR